MSEPGNSDIADTSTAADAISNKGAGHPISLATRNAIEPHMGADLSAARVHNDSAANKAASSINARAFTHGNDIFLGRGESENDARLMAHEATHVVQQNGGIAASSNLLQRQESPQSATTHGTTPTPSDDTATHKEGLNSTEYIQRFSSNIAATLNLLMSRVELNTGSPYASWADGNGRAFGAAMWNLPELNVLPVLTALLQPIRPETVVNRGRQLIPEVTPDGDVYQTDRSKDVWYEDVATELHNALAAQLDKSLKRIMPRYIGRRFDSWKIYQKELAAHKKRQRLDSSGKAIAIQSTDSSMIPQPYSGEIAPSHPIDYLTINALCQPGTVNVDFDRIAKDKPTFDDPYRFGSPRHIGFNFLGAQGAWFWLRVEEPYRDASLEEVAYELYGDPAQAFRMVDAAPMFGFTGVTHIRSEHQQRLKEKSEDPNVAQSALYPGAKEQVGRGNEPLNADPLAELMKGPLADEAALNQAGKLKTPKDANREKVLENMRLSFEVLDAMIPNAKKFHNDGRLAEAATHLQAKRAALLKADDAEVMRWAAQAADQKRILAGASAGLAQAVAQLDQILKGNNAMHGHALPEYLKEPLLEVASAYITAAVQSFFVGSGATALAAADERSRLFGVEMMEGILQSVMHNIEAAEQDKTGTKPGGNEAEFGISKLRAREQALRQRLSEAREAIMRNPDQVDTLLKKIYEEVADLQVETAMVANLDALDTATKALLDSESFLTDAWFQFNALEREIILGLVAVWRSRWSAVYTAWKSGEHEKARERFRELISDPGFKQLFELVNEYVKDAATRNLIARIFTLIVIAAVTWGVGVFVEGVAAGAWGAVAAGGELTGAAATAGFVGATVAEAATFTTLNALLLEPNPTWKSVLGEFAWNLGVFGALRKVSLLYREAEVVKAATEAGHHTLVAAGEMYLQWATLNVTAIARAEIEKRLKGKGTLTKEEIGQILLESTAMFIGMAIAMRTAQPLMKELAATGTTLGVKLRLINAQRARLSALGEVVGSNGEMTRARSLLEQDKIELQAEMDFYQQLLEKPEDLAKAGYKEEQINSLRQMGEQQLAEIGAAQSLIPAEQIGGNEYQMLQEQLQIALAAYRKIGKVELLRTDEATGAQTWLIKPNKGPEFRITTKIIPDPAQVQLAKMRQGLSAKAQTEFDRLVELHGDEAALKIFQNKAKSRRGLEGELLYEVEKRVAAIPSQQRIDAANMKLNDTGFYENEGIRDLIANGRRKDVKSQAAEYIGRFEARQEFKPEDRYEVWGDVEPVEQFGEYKTLADAIADHPGEAPKIHELNGQVWKHITDIDVFVIQRDAGGGKARVAALEQVKTGKEKAIRGEEQNLAALNAMKEIAAGNPKIRLHLNRRFDITDAIDFTTATKAEVRTRGAEGKTGFTKSLKLTEVELDALVDLILGVPKETPK
jgi:hypothetical protein